MIKLVKLMETSQRRDGEFLRKYFVYINLNLICIVEDNILISFPVFAINRVLCRCTNVL